MALSRNQIEVIEDYWKEIEELKRQLKFHITELKANNVKDFETNARYVHLKDVTESIKQTYDSLDDEMRAFADIRYLSKNSIFLDWADVSDELAITKPRLYKMRTKLMNMTARKLGWTSS